MKPKVFKTDTRIFLKDDKMYKRVTGKILTFLFLFSVKFLEYAEAPPDMSELDIAWANMSAADKARDFRFVFVWLTVFFLPFGIYSLFSQGAIAWLCANDGKKNYQHLETELRKREFSTYIIAGDIKITGISYALPHEKTKRDFNHYTYEAIFSCRSHDDALKEIQLYSQDYGENWAKLGNEVIFFFYLLFNKILASICRNSNGRF